MRSVAHVMAARRLSISRSSRWTHCSSSGPCVPTARLGETRRTTRRDAAGPSRSRRSRRAVRARTGGWSRGGDTGSRRSCSATTSDLSTRWAMPSSTSSGSTSVAAATASAASSVKPPANTPRRSRMLAFARFEQVVAPVDGLPQGAVTLDCGSAAAGEQAEALVEAGRDLGGRHHASAGRGQLDGERDAVEPAQICAIVAAVLGVELESPPASGALDEELHRIGREDLLGRRTLAGRSSDRTIIRRSPRTPSPSRPVASTRDVRTRPDERRRRDARRLEEVLTVVEHDEEFLRSERRRRTLSAIDCPGRCRTPSELASTSGNAAGSLSGPSSHSHTPSRYRARAPRRPGPRAASCRRRRHR